MSEESRKRLFLDVSSQGKSSFLFATEIMLELMGKDRHFEINRSGHLQEEIIFLEVVLVKRFSLVFNLKYSFRFHEQRSAVSFFH